MSREITESSVRRAKIISKNKTTKALIKLDRRKVLKTGICIYITSLFVQ